MKIKPFKLERYFAQHEFKAPYLMCCSDCESVSIGDLLAMESGAARRFLDLRLGYTESLGHPELRTQIAGLYEHISADQVLVHAGAEEAIFNLMHVLLEKGDHVLVHYPCYQSLMEVATAIGCEVTLWQSDQDSDWSLDLDFLKQHLQDNTRLVIVNCPHNPTGFLMPKPAFAEMVDLSQRHGFVLFSDEVYRFLEYRPTDRLPAICDCDDRGISLGVMSKSFGLAGLRIGWIATRNRSVYEKLAAFKDYTTICNSAPSEFLATIALKNKDRLVQRNLNIIKHNLKLLDSFFTDHDDLFQWQRPIAGPIGFPALLSGSIDDFCRDLVERTGILLLPGTVYDATCNNFRIGFGRNDFAHGLERLANYLSNGYVD